MQVGIECFHTSVDTFICLKRNLWSDFDVEPTDEFLAKLLHTDNLFTDDNSASEQMDGHAHDLQKRGRRE